jgi:uncharacterized coiled-coil DUF342 family protein
MRLTPERENQIRAALAFFIENSHKLTWYDDRLSDCILELLNEIDAFREDSRILTNRIGHWMNEYDKIKEEIKLSKLIADKWMDNFDKLEEKYFQELKVWPYDHKGFGDQ